MVSSFSLSERYQFQFGSRCTLSWPTSLPYLTPHCLYSVLGLSARAKTNVTPSEEFALKTKRSEGSGSALPLPCCVASGNGLQPSEPHSAIPKRVVSASWGVRQTEHGCQAVGCQVGLKEGSLSRKSSLAGPVVGRDS